MLRKPPHQRSLKISRFIYFQRWSVGYHYAEAFLLIKYFPKKCKFNLIKNLVKNKLKIIKF